MSQPPIFAIITDFGFDFAVASMKGVILRNHADAKIIDIDHSIEHFSLLSAAFVIQKVHKFFPQGTFFICVIDPGVGSNRELVCIETENHTFVGPNNGIFHYIIKNPSEHTRVYIINNNFVGVHSNTFHGRDIITPAAIELARGNRSFLVSIAREKIVSIPLLDSDVFVILYIDGFGNLKTNISANVVDTTSGLLKLKIKDQWREIKFVKTFSEVGNGELLCYLGSNKTLEIAVNFGSAKKVLNVSVGDVIKI